MKLDIIRHDSNDVPKGVESHMHIRTGLVELSCKKEKMNVSLCGDVLSFESGSEVRTIKIVELAQYVFAKKVPKGNKCAYCGEPLWKKPWERPK